MTTLPAGWTTVALGELFKSAGRKAGDSTDHPVYSVTKHSGFVPSDEYFSKQVHSRDLSTYKLVRAGDFAYATIHLDEGSIGIAPKDALISPMYTAFSVDEARVHPPYLLRFMKSPQALAQYELLGSGSVHRRRAISLKRVGDLRLPLPPLPEQRRIATILDKATSARRLVDSSIERYRALRESLIEHSLREVYAQAEPLGELLDFLTSGSRGWAKYYSATGAKFLRIQNVRWGDIHSDDMAYVNPPDTAEARRTAVKSGDVLLSITADLGRTAVVPPEFGTAHINQHLAILRTGQLTPEYLSAFLESSAGMRQLTKKNRGQTKDGLNFDDIRSVLIPRPSSDVERELVAQLHHFRYQTERLKLKAERAQDLLMSLQSRAFQGSL